MKEFKIFEERFTWNKTKIINCIILAMMSVVIFMSLVLKIEKSSLQTSLLIFSFIAFLIGMGFRLLGFNRIQQLQGKFTGNFIIQKEGIRINDSEINFENIKNIEITGVDWVGLRNTNYLLSYNYENGLSNGTKNYLIIEYNNQKQKIQFQQNYACGFREVEDVIKYYYINGKIGYLNCVDILCLNKKEEWDAFKSLKKHYR